MLRQVSSPDLSAVIMNIIPAKVSDRGMVYLVPIKFWFPYLLSWLALGKVHVSLQMMIFKEMIDF